MKTAARAALVLIGLAIYAPLLIILILDILGPEIVLSIGEVLRGDRCTGDCSPVKIIVPILYVLPFLLTFPAFAIVGFVWVRRRHQSDRELKIVDRWIDTRPPVTQPDPPPPPEPKRFYRDRQGRLRPLESIDDRD